MPQMRWWMTNLRLISLDLRQPLFVIRRTRDSNSRYKAEDRHNAKLSELSSAEPM